jgi:UDPglucose 6-dehydrogenase
VLYQDVNKEINRYMTREYEIAIIGVGTVAFAIGNAFEEKGYRVLYIDTDQEVIANLIHSGKNAFLPRDLISLSSGISFICVPTPTLPLEGMDSSSLWNAVLFLGNMLQTSKTYHLVVIKSTVLPGTTEQFVIPQLEHISGKVNGQDFGVCVSPEYLRSNTAIDDAEHPWITVIGTEDVRYLI